MTTVKDLMEKLQTLPPDVRILESSEDGDFEYDCTELKVSTRHRGFNSDYYATCAKTYQRTCGLCENPKEWPLVTMVVL